MPEFSSEQPVSACTYQVLEAVRATSDQRFRSNRENAETGTVFDLVDNVMDLTCTNKTWELKLVIKQNMYSNTNCRGDHSSEMVTRRSWCSGSYFMPNCRFGYGEKIWWQSQPVSFLRKYEFASVTILCALYPELSRALIYMCVAEALILEMEREEQPFSHQINRSVALKNFPQVAIW